MFSPLNESAATVKSVLKSPNDFQPNIKLKVNIDQSAPFLDLSASNQHSILFPSVYHKPAVQSCVVSFTSDHPIVMSLLT